MPASRTDTEPFSSREAHRFALLYKAVCRYLWCCKAGLKPTIVFAIAMAWLAATAGQGQAAVTALTSSISSSGSAPFDAAPGPGNDTSATDQVVRTNDALTYLIQQSTTNASAVTIKIVLPNCDTAPNKTGASYIAGCSTGKLLASWQNLPPQCSGTGSGLSADKQTLTCVRSVSGTASILPVAVISAAAPNAAVLASPAVTATSADTGAAVTTGTDLTPNVVVSAAPKWNLASGDPVNVVSTIANSPRALEALGPNGEAGVVFAYPLSLYAKPLGAYGAELPASGSFSFTDDPGLITSDDPAWQAALRANVRVYNDTGTWPSAALGTANGCSVNEGPSPFRIDSMPWAVPGGVGATGSCTASQPGGPGTLITVNLSGVDFTQTISLPLLNNNYPASATWVQSRLVLLWMPLSALPATGRHTLVNSYSPLVGITSISGQPNADPNPANNTASLSYQVAALQATALNVYSSISVNDFRGTGSASPGQVLQNYIRFRAAGSGAIDTPTICYKVDNTHNTVAPGAGTFSMLLRNHTALTYGTDFTVEYGAGGANGAGQVWATPADALNATCADDQSSVGWRSNPDDPAFANTPGTRDKITKVRFRYLHGLTSSDLLDMNLSLQVVGTPTVGPTAGIPWPDGEVTNSFISISDAGTPSFTSNYAAADKTLDSTGRYWVTQASKTFAQNIQWDKFLLGAAAARLTKTTAVPPSGSTQVQTGTIITYQLQPKLTSATGKSTQTGSVSIEDVLPPELAFVAGSAKQGASLATAVPIAPALVLSNTPSAGYTTLRFDIPSVQVDTALPQIFYNAAVLQSTANGVSLYNLAKISSPLDPQNCVDTSFAPLAYPYVIVGPPVTGQLCPGATRHVLTTSAPPGFFVSKLANTPSIGPGDTLSWTLNWEPITNPVAATDLIDILPYNGDGRGSAFNGTLAVTSLSAVANDAAPASQLLCATSAPADADPASAANWTGGSYPAGTVSATWSAANCATLSAIKAIRIISGASQSAGVTRSLTIAAKSSGNKAGDVYANSVVARAAGLSLTASSNVMPIETSGGALQGTVFEDTNNDGNIQAGEKGIAGTVITLSGYSFGPNGIDDGGLNTLATGGTADDGAPFILSTKTDASGNYCFGAIGVSNPVCSAPIYATANATGAPLATYPGLPAGKYTVSETQPAAYLDGKQATAPGLPQVTNGAVGTTGKNLYSGVVLGVAASGTNFNFGEVKPASLAGLVFADKGTPNGVYDAGTDAPLAGAALRLQGTDDLGTAVDRPLITAADGTFSFTNLRPGVYSLTETNPSGYLDSPAGTVQLGTGLKAGAGTPGLNQVSNLVIGSADSGINYNFGDVPAAPAVGLVKTAGLPVDVNASGSTDAGDTIAYSFSVVNLGNVPLSGIVVSDPKITSPITCTATALNPGATTTCQPAAPYVITQTDVDGGKVTNQATVTANPPTGPPVSDLSDESTPGTGPGKDDPTVVAIAPAAALSLVKQADTSKFSSPAPKPGDVLGYTFTAKNNGNLTLSAVTLAEAGFTNQAGTPLTLSAGPTLLSPSGATAATPMKPGDTWTWTASYQLTQADIDSKSISNQALVHALLPNGTTTLQAQSSPSASLPPGATVTSLLPAGAIGITETGTFNDENADGFAQAGETISFSFTVKNTGNLTLSSIAVSDPPLGTVTCLATTLAAGATTSCSAKLQLTADLIKPGSFTNQASVTATATGGGSVTDLADSTNPADGSQPGSFASGAGGDDPVVVPLPSAPLQAVDDSATNIDGYGGNPNALNVLANDKLAGVAAAAGLVSLSIDPASALPAQLTFDAATGMVGLKPKSPTGTYSFKYQLCEKANPLNCASAEVKVVAVQSSVKGTVFIDQNGDGILNAGEPPAGAGYGVELDAANGAVLAQAVTAADGTFKLPASPGSGISVVFRNPGGGKIGTVANLNVPAGTDVSIANQPIDPSGVIYASITRVPVSGVTVTLAGSGGAALPAACLLAGQQGQLTNATGAYRFDIIPGAAPACPASATRYTIVLSNPAGFTGGISALLPPQPSGLTVAGCSIDAIPGGDCDVAASPAPPPVGTNGLYFTSFIIAAGDPSVVHNHVAVDPLPVGFTKTASVSTVKRGDTVTFVITATKVPFNPATLADQLPPGLSFAPGSATANGLPVVPVITGNVLKFNNLPVDGTGQIKLTLKAVVNAAARPGTITNTATIAYPVTGAVFATAKASVEMLPEAIFDCSDIIGKVFDDKNHNGYPDPGEPGLAGVRLATVNGVLVTTDAEGRYHIGCAALPDQDIGSNFLLKLDTRTLPAGYSVTSENPKSLRLTAGKAVKMNFGAALGNVIEIELRDKFFKAGPLSSNPNVARVMKLLASQPVQGQPTLHVAYKTGADGAAAARQRLLDFEDEIQRRWPGAPLTIIADVVP